MEINKCYNENCLDTMAKMPDGFIDLTVTSPPYDNIRTYNGYSFDFEAVAKELYRVTKQGGVVVWVVGDATVKGSETGTSFRQALFFKECGFNLHDTMIYQSPKPPLTHNRYEQCFEYMFVFSKGKPKTFNVIKEPSKNAGKKSEGTIRQTGKELQGKHKPGIVNELKYRNNIWFYATGMNKTTSDKFAYEHPAMFPEPLCTDHIISWSNECDLVYDPFMGSGTTGKMAILNKRNWIGSEISEEYCKIIERRIATASPRHERRMIMTFDEFWDEHSYLSRDNAEAVYQEFSALRAQVEEKNKLLAEWLSFGGGHVYMNGCSCIDCRTRAAIADTEKE